MISDDFSESRARRTLTAGGRILRALRMDGPLTGALATIITIGFLVVYSASGQNLNIMEHHVANLGVAVIAMDAAEAGRAVVLRAGTAVVGQQPVDADERPRARLDRNAPARRAAGARVPAGIRGVCVEREDLKLVHGGYALSAARRAPGR